jgi:hypothetical protein
MKVANGVSDAGKWKSWLFGAEIEISSKGIDSVDVLDGWAAAHGWCF